MFAPAPAAGVADTSTTTGSRMFPSTSPTRPPAKATTKHQTARNAASTRCLDPTEGRPERPELDFRRNGDPDAEDPADRPIDGFDYEECEHLVDDDDPDTALCGVDQTGVPWNQGFPVCQACVAVAEGRMS